MDIKILAATISENSKKAGEKLFMDFVLSCVIYKYFSFYEVVEAYRAWPEVQSFMVIVGIIMLVSFFILDNIYLGVFQKKGPKWTALKNKFANKIYIVIIFILYVFLFCSYFYAQNIAEDKFIKMSDPFWQDVEWDIGRYIIGTIILLGVASYVFEYIYRKYLHPIPCGGSE
jgi:hypothetical protein